MMRLKIRVSILIFFLGCANPVLAQSYGIEFSSYEVMQEKRTSLLLNPEDYLCFKNKFELSFGLSFNPNRATYFGYIFRLINAHKQNIDLVYDQRNKIFNVVTGETFAHIDFKISDSILFNTWTTLTVKIENGLLSFWQNGKLLGKTKTTAATDNCYKIVFGACNMYDFKTTDLPPMRVRNVRLSIDNRLARYWPLNESSGTAARDSITGKAALAINPNWMRPAYENWKLLQTLSVKGNASFAFDQTNETIYVASNDTLYTYSLKGPTLQATALKQNRHWLLEGNQLIFNNSDNKLYNFFADQHWITPFDFKQQQWAIPFDSAGTTEYWQANKFIAPAEHALFVIGGYGQLKYKNTVQKYDFSSQAWSNVAVRGTVLTPRYLASLATSADGNTAYLLGGYGSTEGSQVLNPRYHYDLIRFDARTLEMKKILSLEEPKEQFVFANSFILAPSGDDFYALAFPNDRFHTELRLIKGSLHAPAYAYVADSIPYTFLDTRSFADLYLCKQSKALLAVTLFTDKNTSFINIYSIAFPPNLYSASVPAGHNRKFVYLLLAIGIVSGVVIYIIRRRTRSSLKPSTSLKPPAPPGDQAAPLLAVSELSGPAANTNPGGGNETREAPATPLAAKSAIILFGNFEVLDAMGNNLTRLFTPLLKELFLLIALYTLRPGRGISSEKLNEILWNDKSDKDAKNNRSVNMVKLKNILEELGECSISREAGKWQLHYNPDEVHIDLVTILTLAARKQPLTRQETLMLIASVQRGALLHQTDYGWLEDIKSDISNKVIDILTTASIVTDDHKEPELLIEIANCIFLFDPVNEHALKIKCRSFIFLRRHSLARNLYEKYTKEYHQLYGENFPESFNDLIA